MTFLSSDVHYRVWLLLPQQTVEIPSSEQSHDNGRGKYGPLRVSVPNLPQDLVEAPLVVGFKNPLTEGSAKCSQQPP